VINRLRSDELATARNCSFTAVVGIGRRALAFIATFSGFPIEVAGSETVEWPHEQKHCYNGYGNVNATTHSF
jgi:hypothetical protein